MPLAVEVLVWAVAIGQIALVLVFCGFAWALWRDLF